jgi:hypothetical protein
MQNILSRDLLSDHSSSTYLNPDPVGVSTFSSSPRWLLDQMKREEISTARDQNVDQLGRRLAIEDCLETSRT